MAEHLLSTMARGLFPVMLPTAIWLDLMISILQIREVGIKGVQQLD